MLTICKEVFKMKENNVLSLDFFREYPRITHGKGIYMYTEDGTEIIDGASGPVLVSLGHGITEMGDVMKEQSDKIAFVHRDDCITPVLEESCKKITEASGNHLTRIFQVCGGSEANEIAIKLVRKYHIYNGNPSKYKLISRWQSYHGISNGVLSISGFAKRRAGYEPYLTEFPKIPPAYCYRCWFGKECGKCNLECAQALENEILAQGPDTVAAFFAEPISGMSLCAAEPPAGYFKRIREICDKYDVLLVLDEVMTGIGRTGKYFAFQHYGILPDMVSMGKALSGGYFPVAAVGISDKVYQPMVDAKGNFPPGFSWSGNPLGAAVSLKAFEILERDNLVERSEKMGAYLKKKCEEKLYKHPTVGDIRGRGLMIGIELVKDKATKQTFPSSVRYSAQVQDECLEYNMLIEASAGCNKGVAGDTLMFAPAFIVTEEQIDTMVEKLDLVLTIVEQRNGF